MIVTIQLVNETHFLIVTPVSMCKNSSGGLEKVNQTILMLVQKQSLC